MIRDRQSRVEATGTAAPQQGRISIRPPLIKGGVKMLDVWVKEKGRVVNWASVAFEVAPRICIKQLALAMDILRKGEQVRGAIRLSTQPTNDLNAVIEVEDNFGRVVASLAPTLTSDRLSFALSVRTPMTKAHTLRVVLMDEDGVLDEAEAPFFINTSEEAVDDFSFFAWGSAWAGSRSVTTYLRQFNRFGIDTLYNTTSLWDDSDKTREIAMRVTRANLQIAPYATRLFLASRDHAHLRPVRGPDGPEIRNCPLSLTPEDRAKTKGIMRVRMLARTLGPFGPAYYSLGDENALSWPGEDVCFCPKCQRSFREYLKNVYGSLAALNKEWGTRYPDWQEVKPIALMGAYKQKRYPQWVDHRLHMDKLFADLHGAYAKAITDADPAAKVGIEGPVYPTHSYTGFDLYRMLQHFKYFNPYNAVPAVKTTCFLPKDSITGIWFGSYRSNTGEGIMRYTPWHCLFEGMTAVGWWTTGVGGNRGLGGPAAFSPDYVPLPFFKQACEEIDEIKSGIGKLLIGAERVIHPIALYYSNSCLHAATIRCKETTWENSLNDFHFALRDAGYEYRYLAPQEIQAGALSRYKVLILPYAQAISARDVEKIKDFVRKGGMLMADFSPGVMDEHGKMLPESPLLEVFGEFRRMKISRYGKGRAVFFSDYLKGYVDKRRAGEGRGIVAGLIRLLSELAGLKPFAEVTDAAAQNRQDVEISAFRNGSATHLCLLRAVSAGSAAAAKGPEGSTVAGVAAAGPSTIEVKLPSVAQVYDVRAKKYLGRTARLTLALAPSQGKVLALLPARLQRLSVATGRAEYRRGEDVQFTARLAPPALNNCGLAVRVEVYGPNGQRLPYYTQKLVSLNTTFRGTIPLSLNERRGRYRLLVKDIVAGLKAESTFDVE